MYNESYVYLCAVAVKYVYNAEIAKEIVNDVFLNIWNRQENLQHPVSSYLVRSVKNRCLNHLRDIRLKEVSMTDIQEGLLSFREMQITTDTHPLALLEDKEFQDKIYQAIQQLPEKCREIFIQHIYYNKTYEEIAKELNISSSTVRGQIRIGLGKLKPLLGDLYITFLFIFYSYQK